MAALVRGDGGARGEPVALGRLDHPALCARDHRGTFRRAGCGGGVAVGEQGAAAGAFDAGTADGAGGELLRAGGPRVGRIQVVVEDRRVHEHLEADRAIGDHQPTEIGVAARREHQFCTSADVVEGEEAVGRQQVASRRDPGVGPRVLRADAVGEGAGELRVRRVAVHERARRVDQQGEQRLVARDPVEQSLGVGDAPVERGDACREHGERPRRTGARAPSRIRKPAGAGAGSSAASPTRAQAQRRLGEQVAGERRLVVVAELREPGPRVVDRIAGGGEAGGDIRPGAGEQLRGCREGASAVRRHPHRRIRIGGEHVEGADGELAAAFVLESLVRRERREGELPGVVAIRLRHGRALDDRVERAPQEVRPCRAHPRVPSAVVRMRWQYGQKCEPRFMNTSRTIGRPQRGHGSPCRP